MLFVCGGFVVDFFACLFPCSIAARGCPSAIPFIFVRCPDISIGIDVRTCDDHPSELMWAHQPPNPLSPHPTQSANLTTHKRMPPQTPLLIDLATFSSCHCTADFPWSTVRPQATYSSAVTSPGAFDGGVVFYDEKSIERTFHG